MPNTTTAADVAARMETIRRHTGKPVTKLAAAAGIADKTFRRHQAAPGKFLLEELIATARVLDVDVADFFVADDEATKEAAA